MANDDNKAGKPAATPANGKQQPPKVDKASLEASKKAHEQALNNNQTVNKCLK